MKAIEGPIVTWVLDLTFDEEEAKAVGDSRLTMTVEAPDDPFLAAVAAARAVGSVYYSNARTIQLTRRP